MSLCNPEDADRIEDQLKSLQSRIGDLGHEVDAGKARTAAALGAGVFLFLLAAGAAYDLAVGKTGVWSTVGVSREVLVWIAWGFGGAALVLFAAGIPRVIRSDRIEGELNKLESEYAALLEPHDSERSTAC